MEKICQMFHISLVLALGGAPRADIHMKPPRTMGHEFLIQRRPSLGHPGLAKIFFSDIQSITINYRTPRRMLSEEMILNDVSLG